ncbi:MAG: acetylxylan esterase [Opitutales bacterium]|nr:acetylxylan esterase [Opitutales bacterium]
MEPTRHEESQVPAYTLPDPLVMEDGTPVAEAGQWSARRAELLEILSARQYGFAPPVPVSVKGKVVSEDSDALDGAATMKQVEVVLTHGDKSRTLGLLLFLPNAAAQPVPAFVGLNFFGNHTSHADPRIRLHGNWSPNNEALRVTDNRATEDSRGLRAHRWPAEEIIARGYALATVYAGDVDPDHEDGCKDGVHGLFGETDHTAPPEERWGTIAAWSWGLSRILDYMEESEPAVDGARVIALGHSRMGKAALWAGATDTRFAATISNNSGCVGAALHRRRFGERLVDINTNFPHWLNDRSKSFNERESDLPFDQHQLLALIAPRPLYVASAAEDLWADPKGEFLALLHAEPVWQLLGIRSDLPREMPDVGGSLTGPLGYHIRPGKHDLLSEDWVRFLDFTDRMAGS